MSQICNSIFCDLLLETWHHYVMSLFIGWRLVLHCFLCPATRKWRGIMLYPPKFWVSVRPSVRLSVCPSVRPFVSAHHHSCIGNSSYSFRPILLKLYRCFKDGLKICILFFQNPEIIFYHFFPIFNLDIFRALILQICIWSMYLVSATPPTVFGESFWNFTVVFRMVWRYAYCFLRILKLFFLHFNLDIFSSLYATDMYREYMPCIGNPTYSFRPILLKLYRYFAAFLWFHMRNLSLAGYNCSGGASCMACSFIMPRHQKVAGYYVIPSEILSVRPSVCLSVRPSVRQRPPPFLYRQLLLQF